jgi:hypothetical protein
MDRARDSLSAWWDRRPEFIRTIFDSHVSEDDFNNALESWIVDAIARLEENVKDFDPNHQMSENGLSSVLASEIRMPGIKVSREENSNGHVDLTIEVESSLSDRKRLGEAKIWKGPVHHLEGLDQLLNRYSTGRCNSGFMFAYVREAKIKEKFKSLKDKMDVEKPCEQTENCQDHPFAKWALVSKHEHRSGETLRVVHFGCNFCWL